MNYTFIKKISVKLQDNYWKDIYFGVLEEKEKYYLLIHPNIMFLVSYITNATKDNCFTKRTSWNSDNFSMALDIIQEEYKDDILTKIIKRLYLIDKYFITTQNSFRAICYKKELEEEELLELGCSF